VISDYSGVKAQWAMPVRSL